MSDPIPWPEGHTDGSQGGDVPAWSREQSAAQVLVAVLAAAAAQQALKRRRRR